MMIRGTNEIRKGPNVELLEATRLLTPIQGLTDATQAATNAWITAKNTIIRSGGREVVLKILRTQESNADVYTDAMVGKLPEVSKYIGRQYSQRVRASFEQAISQFK